MSGENPKIEAPLSAIERNKEINFKLLERWLLKGKGVYFITADKNIQKEILAFVSERVPVISLRNTDKPNQLSHEKFESVRWDETGNDIFIMESIKPEIDGKYLGYLNLRRELVSRTQSGGRVCLFLMFENGQDYVENQRQAPDLFVFRSGVIDFEQNF